MRRYTLFFLLAIIAVAQSGCGDGVALTRRERHALHKDIRENDRRQLTDDWDSIMLNERKSRLSWWRVE